MYTRNGQGIELKIKKTEKGFLIEHNSSWSGNITGFRALYYYSDAWPKSTDLEARHNNYYDNGEILYEAVKNGEPGKYYRLLSKGSVVR